MTAMRLIAPGDARLVTIARPEAKAGEVLLRVLAAGVCRTDLHISSAADSRTPSGTVLGHEVAGEIVAVGSGVAQSRVGLQGIVHPCFACGTCRACREGKENYCHAPGRVAPPTPGVTCDGGMAEYVAVPDSAFFPTGGLDPGVAATLTDAGLTAYHSVRLCHGLLQPGSTVVVVGLGGLGNMAVQILAATSAARIVGIDRSAEARAAVASLAASLHDFDEGDLSATIVRATGGVGVEVVLDFVGSDDTMRLAASIVARGGAIQVVGLSGGTYPFVGRSANNPLPRGATLMCPYSGSYRDLAEVIALARSGAIDPLVTRFPLSAATDVFGKLGRGEIVGRAVLIPG